MDNPNPSSLSKPMFSDGWRLLALLAMIALAMLLFLTLNKRASWAFTLQFRGYRLLSLILVGYSIALSTLVFQTITHNRILAPGIMGFDSLFVVLQTSLVFVFGAQWLQQLPASHKWLMEASVLCGVTSLLFYWLWHKQGKDLQTLVLVGILMGIVLRSLSGFMGRMLDPVEYDQLQDLMFASFNKTKPELLLISGLSCALASSWLWYKRRQLDVLYLGKEVAISLGVPYQALVLRALLIISLLIAVSTALVGPVTFFGLLVVNLAYLLVREQKHCYLIPMATGLAILVLVLGQALLEQVFRFGTALSVIVEFVGGLAFLILLLRQGRR